MSLKINIKLNFLNTRGWFNINSEKYAKICSKGLKVGRLFTKWTGLHLDHCLWVAQSCSIRFRALLSRLSQAVSVKDKTIVVFFYLKSSRSKFRWNPCPGSRISEFWKSRTWLPGDFTAMDLFNRDLAGRPHSIPEVQVLNRNLWNFNQKFESQFENSWFTIEPE